MCLLSESVVQLLSTWFSLVNPPMTCLVELALFEKTRSLPCLIKICSHCHQALCQKNVSRFALVSGLYCGGLPECFHDLTWPNWKRKYVPITVLPCMSLVYFSCQGISWKSMCTWYECNIYGYSLGVGDLAQEHHYDSIPKDSISAERELQCCAGNSRLARLLSYPTCWGLPNELLVS